MAGEVHHLTEAQRRKAMHLSHDIDRYIEEWFVGEVDLAIAIRSMIVSLADLGHSGGVDTEQFILETGNILRALLTPLKGGSNGPRTPS